MTAPDRIAVNVPAHALPARSSRELLALARTNLTEAAALSSGMRYATAHLAALRAAAAVLAGRAIPARHGQRAKVTSVWALLVQVAPELTEWEDRWHRAVLRRHMAANGLEDPSWRNLSEREKQVLRDADEKVIAESGRRLPTGMGAA